MSLSSLQSTKPGREESEVGEEMGVDKGGFPLLSY